MKKSAGASSTPKTSSVAAIVSARLVPVVAILWMVAPTYAAPVTDPASGHTYEVITDTKKWDDAGKAAEGMSTVSQWCHLATITSAAENDFIASQVNPPDNSWLGGHQKDPDPPGCTTNDPSLWGTWVTGEAWSYTNWHPGPGGEPDECGEACLTWVGGPWGNDVCNDPVTEGINS